MNTITAARTPYEARRAGRELVTESDLTDSPERPGARERLCHE